MHISHIPTAAAPPSFTDTQQQAKPSDHVKKTSQTEETDNKADKPSQKNEQTNQLTPDETKQLRALKSRDQEVRSHEAAHKAAAGQYATGGASFTYQRGPDGQRYAVGGEVGIDSSPVSGDPEATINKANQIQAAALAPAQPSSQDLAVAAAAAAMASEARAEINSERYETSSNDESKDAENQSDSNRSKTDQYSTIANTPTTTREPLLDLLA